MRSAVDGGRLDITPGGEGVCSDSSSVDNKALAVNVLLPGKLQGHNLLQMLEAHIQLVVVVVEGRHQTDTAYTAMMHHLQPTTVTVATSGIISENK